MHEDPRDRRIKDLEEALESLVDLYVKNKGTSYEFIACASVDGWGLSIEERKKCKYWSAFDRARILLSSWMKDQGKVMEDQNKVNEAMKEDKFNQKLEEVLGQLNGPKESFRGILTNERELLGKVCRYAYLKSKPTSKRAGRPPWSIIGDIFGHGSGVSSAIYKLYKPDDLE